jgi:hypothetical protein
MGVSEAPSLVIDPALAGIGSPGQPSDGDESAQDRAQEIWVENMRIIEALRNLVSELLSKGLYEEDEDVKMGEPGSQDEDMRSRGSGKVDVKTEGKSLYPVLNV